MPTLADFQEDAAPGFVAATDEKPDLTKHDPNTFAALTGQDYLKTLYAQGLMPVADDVKAVEAKALDTAINFHKAVAEGQAAANTDLQKRIAAVTPTFTKDGVRMPSLTEQEEKAKALVEIQKQQAETQWGQGAAAVAAAQAQPGGIAAGQVSKMTDEQTDKFASYLEGAHNIQNLHALFDAMARNTAGAGGALKSGLGLLTPITQLTSPEARTYHAYAESSVIPLAKGLMGDAATTAGRPDVSAKMLDAMPGNVDNLQSGGQKVFMMLDRNLDNLKTQRDLLRGKGIDTSAVDSKIMDVQRYFDSPDVQKYNPLKNPVVQLGTSDQANATTAIVNAGASAGVQAPQTSLPGASPSGSFQQPAPPVAGQPQVQPSVTQQHEQALQAAQQIGQTEPGYLGSKVSRVGRKIGGAAVNAADWLGSLLPENWANPMPQGPTQNPAPLGSGNIYNPTQQ
jgi:hypothetical protein